MLSRWVLGSILMLVPFSGCVSHLDEELMRIRTVKYAADSAYTQQLRQFVVVADKMVAKKHGLQQLIIDNTYADWLRSNGGQYDESGKLVGGKVDLVLFTQTLEVKRKQERALRASIDSWNKAKGMVLTATAAYERANKETMKTEDDAYKAKQSAQDQLNRALEAFGVFSAAIVAASG